MGEILVQLCWCKANGSIFLGFVFVADEYREFITTMEVKMSTVRRLTLFVAGTVGAISPMMRFMRHMFIDEMVPLKGDAFFHQYYQLRDDIHRSRNNRDWKRLAQYYVPMVIILINCIHFLYLYSADLTYMEATIHFDIFRWIHSHHSFYLAIICILFVVIYYLHLVYFGDETSEIVETKRKIPNNEMVIYYYPFRYKKQNCTQYLRNKEKWIMGLLQMFVLMLGTAYRGSSWGFTFLLADIVMITEMLIYYWRLSLHGGYFFTSIRRIWKIVVSHFWVFTYQFSMFSITHSHIIVASLGMFDLLTWRIQLWQFSASLAEFRRTGRPSLRYVMRMYRKILLTILSRNGIVSQTFMSFLYVNVPLNCFFFVSIFLQIGYRAYRYKLSIFCFYQIAAIFGFHLGFAYSNSQLRRAFHPMLNVPLRPMPVQQRIRLSLMIQAIHTDKPYGLCYHKNMGIISMLNLSRVSFSVHFQEKINFCSFHTVYSSSLATLDVHVHVDGDTVDKH